jgi:hypothetical protein
MSLQFIPTFNQLTPSKKCDMINREPLRGLLISQHSFAISGASMKHVRRHRASKFWRNFKTSKF